MNEKPAYRAAAGATMLALLGKLLAGSEKSSHRLGAPPICSIKPCSGIAQAIKNRAAGKQHGFLTSISKGTDRQMNTSIFEINCQDGSRNNRDSISPKDSPGPRYPRRSEAEIIRMACDSLSRQQHRRFGSLTKSGRLRAWGGM